MNLKRAKPITKSLISKRQLCLAVAALTLGGLPTASWSAETTPADSSAQVDSGSDPRILPDLEQERLQALANSQLADTQILWLETTQESFLGLYQEANSATPAGAVLLLHHDRTSADWPGSITTLRKGLPDQGWHTLSIALPDQPEYIPPRTQDVVLADLDPLGQPSEAQPSATGATAEPEEKDKLKAHFEQISARIEAGLNYLGLKQPPLVLILGEGTGGYWALRYSVGLGESSTLLPVLIDALPPTTPTQPALKELVSKLQRPTLDLYHGNGRNQQRVEVLAQQRRDASKRQGTELLISSRMPSRAGDWRQPDERLLGVIRGMLPRLIAANQTLETAQSEPIQATPGKRR